MMEKKHDFFRIFFSQGEIEKSEKIIFLTDHAEMTFGNANKRFKRVLRGFRAFPLAFASIQKNPKYASGRHHNIMDQILKRPNLKNKSMESFLQEILFLNKVGIHHEI